MEDIKSQVKVKDTHKIKKKRIILALLSCVKKIRKEKNIQSIYLCYEDKRFNILIHFNILIFSYVIIIYIVEKIFYHYCLQVFSTEEISKHHVKGWFKINGKKGLYSLKNGEYVKFKTFKRKTK